MTNSIEKICHQVIELSNEAAQFILQEQDKIQAKNIERKGQHDFVTYVDKTSEQMLINGLREILPKSGFIAEEKSIAFEPSEYYWIIDPLDGTTNFIHGVPFYSISIALMHGKQPILGVVNDMCHRDIYYAWQNGPAYVSGEEIKVSTTSHFDDALVVTGFPYYDFSQLNQYLELLRYLMQHSAGIRRPGSAAIDLVYTAAGKFDVFFEHGLSAWDVAAGSFIAKQAGAKVSDFSGGDDYIFGREIIVGNPVIYDEFLILSKQYFNK